MWLSLHISQVCSWLQRHRELENWLNWFVWVQCISGRAGTC